MSNTLGNLRKGHASDMDQGQARRGLWLGSRALSAARPTHKLAYKPGWDLLIL